MKIICNKKYNGYILIETILYLMVYAIIIMILIILLVLTIREYNCISEKTYLEEDLLRFEDKLYVDLKNSCVDPKIEEIHYHDPKEENDNKKIEYILKSKIYSIYFVRPDLIKENGLKRLFLHLISYTSYFSGHRNIIINKNYMNISMRTLEKDDVYVFYVAYNVQGKVYFHKIYLKY